MATLQYELGRVKSDGSRKVSIILSYKGKRKRIPINLTVEKKDFSKNGKVLSNKMQRIIDVKIGELKSRIYNLELENAAGDVEWLYNNIIKKNDNVDFFAFAEQWLQKSTIKGKKNYRSMLNALKKYQRSMNALDKALDAFDIDTYMRYNGIKNQLRQGYNAKEWEFNSMSDAELKETVDSYIEENATDNTINPNNQRIENKDNEQYEAAVKSAGRVFKSTFNILGNEQQGMGRGSKEKAGNNKSLREQLHEESSRQQKDLISWATKNNQLVVEPNDYCICIYY